MDRFSAMKLAIKSHDGELDKGGRMCILHPLAVARLVAPLGEDFEVVAWLHDTVEDTRLTMEDVERRCTEAQASGVYAMTRQEGEAYLGQYIPRAAEDPIGAFVKIADHLHNSNPERLAALPAEQRGIVSRYRRGTELILESDDFQWHLAELTKSRPEWRDDPRLAWLLALTS